MTGIPSTERAALGVLARSALAINGLALVNLVLARTLASPLSVVLFGALLTGFVAQRLGVEETSSDPRRRWQMAASVLVVLPIVAVAVALSWSPRAEWLRPNMDLSVALALVESLALSYRNTLWLCIIPAHAAMTAKIPTRYWFGFVPAACLAAVWGDANPTVAGVGLVVAFGCLSLSLWLRSQNVWVPIVAQGTWLFARDALCSGTLFQLPVETTAFGVHATTNGLALALFVALVAAFMAWRTPSLLVFRDEASVNSSGAA